MCILVFFRNTTIHMHVSRVGLGCGPHTHEMILDQFDHFGSNELLKTIPILASRSQMRTVILVL
jgi:hypothetical protein